MKRMGRGMAFLFFIVMAYVLTGVLLLALAFLLWRFQLSERMVGAGIILIYVMATFTAGFLAGKKAKNRKWAWGLLMGLGYYVILAGMSFFYFHTVSFPHPRGEGVSSSYHVFSFDSSIISYLPKS